MQAGNHLQLCGEYFILEFSMLHCWFVVMSMAKSKVLNVVCAMQGRLALRTVGHAIVSVGLLYDCCDRKAMVGAYQSIGRNTANLYLLIAERQYTAFTQRHRRLQPRLGEAATAK